MPSNLARFAIFFVLVIPRILNAQDKIYSNSGIFEGKISEVTTTVVTYLPKKSSKSVSIYVKDTYLIFNGNGAYLIPSNMDFSLKENQQIVKEFLQNNKNLSTADRIYKIDKTISEGNISKEEKSFIHLGKDGLKIDKKNIAAIIYKDGRHKIISSLPKTAEILWALQVTTNKNTVQVIHSKKGEAISQDSILFDSKKISKSEKDNLDTKQKVSAEINPEQALVDNGKKTTGKQDKSSTPVSAQKPKINDLISAPLIADFEKKSKEKATQFSNYLKIICSKQADGEEVNKAITQALLLFVEDATIEVSSLNKAPVKHSIKRYLELLSGLKYDKVELIWTNVQYVTEIRKGPDGNYYGTITFEQVFNGYRDNILIYSDVTIKKTNVTLKAYDKIIDGKIINLWDVLLGDIGVEATRST